MELKNCPRIIDQKVQILRSKPEVKIANVVLLSRDGYYLMVVPRDEIIVRLENPARAAEYFGPDWPRVRPLSGTPDQFILPLPPPTSEELLFKVKLMNLDPEVIWAEPNFLLEGVPPPFFFVGFPEDISWEGDCYPSKPTLRVQNVTAAIKLLGQGQPFKISRIESTSDFDSWSVLTNITTADGFSVEVPHAEEKRFFRMLYY